MSEHQMHFSIVAHKYPESADHGRQLHYTAVGVFAGHFAANPNLEEEIMNWWPFTMVRLEDIITH